MAPPEQSKAQGLGDDEDVELVPDNCAASCVTCGQDPTSTNWPIASSLSCLVGAGCVVLPPDDMDDETLLRKRSDGTTAAVARPRTLRAGAAPQLASYRNDIDIKRRVNDASSNLLLFSF